MNVSVDIGAVDLLYTAENRVHCLLWGIDMGFYAVRMILIK